jgi:hypothetical protein
MESRKERDEFGEEAEVFCHKGLERENIKVIRSKDRSDWTPLLDRKIGDLIIVLLNQYLFIDIKRNSISKDSLHGFKGDYYFVYNVNLTELFIFKPKDIKNCKELSYETLASGDPGIKLFRLKSHVPYITWDEFIKLVKN